MQEKVPSAYCEQRRPRSACTFGQAGQGLYWPLTESMDIIVYVDEQGPVVQSVISSLRVISLIVLADSIYNIMIFFAEKNVSSFCSAKATHIFSAKNFSILAYHSM